MASLTFHVTEILNFKKVLKKTSKFAGNSKKSCQSNVLIYIQCKKHSVVYIFYTYMSLHSPLSGDSGQTVNDN